MGQVTSWRFFWSDEADSASLSLLENSRRVSSMSSKPAGGGLRERAAVRTGGMMSCDESDIARCCSCLRVVQSGEA